MTFMEFVQLVEELRHAQRDFFRTKSQSSLADAKRLEKKVDIACRRLRDGQGTLFGDEGQ